MLFIFPFRLYFEANKLASEINTFIFLSFIISLVLFFSKEFISSSVLLLLIRNIPFFFIDESISYFDKYESFDTTTRFGSVK